MLSIHLAARAFALALDLFDDPTQGLRPGLMYSAPSGLSHRDYGMFAQPPNALSIFTSLTPAAPMCPYFRRLAMNSPQATRVGAPHASALPAPVSRFLHRE